MSQRKNNTILSLYNSGVGVRGRPQRAAFGLGEITGDYGEP